MTVAPLFYSDSLNLNELSIDVPGINSSSLISHKTPPPQKKKMKNRKLTRDFDQTVVVV